MGDRHRLHDADSPGVPGDHLIWFGPTEPFLMALLHVPLIGRVEAEVPLLPVPLPLQEKLGLLQAGAHAPVRRPPALRRDPEAEDRAAVLHKVEGKTNLRGPSCRSSIQQRTVKASATRRGRNPDAHVIAHETVRKLARQGSRRRETKRPRPRKWCTRIPASSTDGRLQPASASCLGSSFRSPSMTVTRVLASDSAV